MKPFRFIYRSTKKFILNLSAFGPKVAFYSFLFDYIIKINCNSSAKKWFIEKKHQAIINYIRTKYQNVIQEFKDKKWNISNDSGYNNYIWICWWQGEENLDEITSCCVNSIRKHAKNHTIKFITQNNYQNYVHISPYIINKMDQGLISFTQFSDILRMNLLYTHGGLWLDATMFLTKEIPIEVFTKKLYSQKGEKFGHFVSDCKWSGFFIGGNKNGLLFEYMKSIFNAYWEHENHLIDYYLIDYLIKVGYEDIPEIRKNIDNIPNNNPHIYTLEALLNKKYDENIFSQIKRDTSFYKLSRKTVHHKFTEKGEYTFYYHIINS